MCQDGNNWFDDNMIAVVAFYNTHTHTASPLGIINRFILCKHHQLVFAILIHFDGCTKLAIFVVHLMTLCNFQISHEN